MKKIKIIITLGPKTLNKNFLISIRDNVDLLRLNMSHLSLDRLKKNIFFIRRHSKIPICIDTEGAQIRSKILKTKILKRNQKFKIFLNQKKLSFYPHDVFKKLKINDILSIGFDNLLIKILKKYEKKNYFLAKVINSGKFENNKGVHLVNRKINLNFLTQKDFKAIELGKKLKVNFYALSFTNTPQDVKNFNKLLPHKNKIFKIETLTAVNNFKKIIKIADNFLIDRGDLSKDVSIEKTPIFQRKLFLIKKKFKENKNIFVATNLLESMMKNNYPTRGEANDIYSSLEMGANGLVLAAETAIGNYPLDTITFIKRMINAYLKTNHKK